MPKPPKIPHPITQIRKALDLSTPELARTLGISNSLLKKIEAGKRPMTTEIRGRVYFETGVMILDGERNEVVDYSSVKHTEWHAELPNRPEHALRMAHVLSKQMLVLLESAGRPRVGKMTQVFNAVLSSLDRIKDEFHLNASVHGQQRDRHLTEPKRVSVGELWKIPFLAELYGFNNRPDLKDEEELVLEKPTGWFPTKEAQALLFEGLMAAEESDNEGPVIQAFQKMEQVIDGYSAKALAAFPPQSQRQPQPPVGSSSPSAAPAA